MAEKEHSIFKEMGYTHADFMRHLPKAVGGAAMNIEEHAVEVAGRDGRRLRIELGPESERKIGFFRIPVLPVTLRFSGYGEDEVKAALEQFARAFQKGGG